MAERLPKVTLPVGNIGNAKIKRFMINGSERKTFSDFREKAMGRGIPAGEYTQLLIDGHLVMSDTPAEMLDHYEAIERATGHCLVSGLGLGLVVQGMLLKADVYTVTVVESNKNVIDLVGDHYERMFPGRIEIINADVFEWEPARKYDMAWHDIWSDICGDNLAEMRVIRERYKPYVKWQGFWSEDLCLRMRDR